MAKKSDKKKGRPTINEVVTREYTINVHKRIHGVWVHDFCMLCDLYVFSEPRISFLNRCRWILLSCNWFCGSRSVFVPCCIISLSYVKKLSDMWWMCRYFIAHIDEILLQFQRFQEACSQGHQGNQKVCWKDDGNPWCPCRHSSQQTPVVQRNQVNALRK